MPRQLLLLLLALILVALPAAKGKAIRSIHPSILSRSQSVVFRSAISIATHHRASHGSGGQEK